MGTPSHTYDGVKLEILQTLINVFIRQIVFCRSKAFYEDGYDKIHELSNFKGNLLSHFSRLSTELDFKESFLRKWNSLLNTNETLNIQFNYP